MGIAFPLLKKTMVIGLVLVAVIAAAGSIYEALSTFSYRQHQPPGRLVNVAGYRQYIYCQGNGSPEIIFDGGLGDASDVWRDIHAKAAAISRACVFDRLGLGWSDTGPAPRSAMQISKEFRALLAASGEQGPYILVAHSMAGYNARTFASQNLKDVSGILLLDVAHPDQNARESEAANKDRNEFIKKQGWWARLGPFGITRILGHCEWSPQDCGRSYQTTVDEFGPFNTISPAQVRAAGNLGNVPLIVLSHDPDLEIRLDPSEVHRRDEAVDFKMQEELSELSTLGCHIVAEGSKHYIQDDRPDLVLKSLRILVEQSRPGVTDAFKRRCAEIH
jgi:pimeloyl-ACP methyl ester carboxylesterase